MPRQPKKTKLSIYLIKEAIENPEEIFRNEPGHEDIEDIGTLYYWHSANHEPSWLQSFLGGRLTAETRNAIFGASARAVVLVRVQIRPGVHRLFAVTFGNGWQYLNKDVFEERFGLLCTLNTIDPDQLRKVDSKNIASIPKDMSEQLSKAGVASDFAIDPEQSLIVGIAGVAADSGTFGKIVTGRDAFNVTVATDLSNIGDFLELCYKKYADKGYREQFDWIDHISQVRAPKRQSELDKQLLASIQPPNQPGTWMAVPDIVQWQQISGFRYSKNGELFDDIDLPNFLASLSNNARQDLTIKTLKTRQIICVRTDQTQEYCHWNAYRCLYCEVHKDDIVFLLSGGKWYEIQGDYVTQINAAYKKFRDAGSSTTLPPMLLDRQTNLFEREDEYSQRVAGRQADRACLDCKLIRHGSTHSKIEFCDIYEPSRFIHVKKYGASSVLSHLFAQGLVPAELFLEDEEFRRKLNKKLPDALKLRDVSAKPDVSGIEVVFAIASSRSGVLELPFFSKVTLTAARKQLERLGYKPSLLKIEADRTG